MLRFSCFILGANVKVVNTDTYKHGILFLENKSTVLRWKGANDMKWVEKGREARKPMVYDMPL